MPHVFHAAQYARPARIFHVADVCMLPAGRLRSRRSQSRIISPVPCFSWGELKLLTLFQKDSGTEKARAILQE